MEIFDIISTRRIIKKFKTDPISREKLVTWLSVASMAPNHRMTEPWEIIFIGPQTRKNIHHKTDFGGAPIVFAVLSKQGKNEVEREENRSATSCFMQNFMLLAWADKVGTFWSSVGITPKNRALLGVKDDYDVIGVFAVGVPEEIPAAKIRTLIIEKISEIP